MNKHRLMDLLGRLHQDLRDRSNEHSQLATDRGDINWSRNEAKSAAYADAASMVDKVMDIVEGDS